MADLTATQRRALRVIGQMSRNGDPAHDLEGDLSLTSGNWPATHHALVRRGLVDAEYVPEYGGILEPFFEYWLTDAGRAALSTGQEE